jgi:sucrose phosphorylase
VYYVGLLAGENDMALLAKSGVGRDINRHHYSVGEIDAALQKPVVQRLVELIQLRNTHPAFGGSFTLDDSPREVLAMRWQHGDAWIALRADLAAGDFTIESGPRA